MFVISCPGASHSFRYNFKLTSSHKGPVLWNSISIGKSWFRIVYLTDFCMNKDKTFIDITLNDALLRGEGIFDIIASSSVVACWIS